MKKYFPYQLSATFLYYAGDIKINCDDLLKEFLQYLPDTNSCLEDFSAADEEEILDFLEDYWVKMKLKRTKLEKS